MILFWSSVKVYLGSNLGLNSTCDEGKINTLIYSHPVTHWCSHLCFVLIQKGTFLYWTTQQQQHTGATELKDLCCFQRRARGSIWRISWQVTATEESLTLPTMTARLWRLIEGLWLDSIKCVFVFRCAAANHLSCKKILLSLLAFFKECVWVSAVCDLRV